MPVLEDLMNRAVLLDAAGRALMKAPLDPIPDHDEGDADVYETDPGLDEEEKVRGPLGGAIGLNPAQRIAARKRITRACWLGYSHRGAIHYTQGSRRWAVATRRRSKDRGYPHYADCSAYATYLHWDATVDHHLRDFVNGFSWRAGFTGTMVRHGVRISRPALVGDCVFYGGSFSRPHHVAVYIGRGRVFSHGQESGPLILPWHYRSVVQVRRYIR